MGADYTESIGWKAGRLKRKVLSEIEPERNRGIEMARTVSIGNQDFESLRVKNCFYVDKTGFIREWWESEDVVTLIARPRRFGKTLNMNMLEKFFSVEYAGRSDLFEGLDIWKEEKYRRLQGRSEAVV